jgi:hypothetical protein
MSRVGAPNPLLAKPAKSISVPLVSLDGWCKGRGINPDWLFLDVEGFEEQVLAGAAETIHSRGSNLGIVVEMHPDLWAASGTSRDEIAAQIAGLGRRAVSLTGQADPFGEHGHVLLDLV